MNRAAWSVTCGHLLVLVACARTGPKAPPNSGPELIAEELEPLCITHLTVHDEAGSILAFEPIPMPDLDGEAGPRAVLLDSRTSAERSITLIAADAATRATTSGAATPRHVGARVVGLDVRWR